MEHDEHDGERLERIERLVERIDERTEQMAIDQATFDTDLAALVQAVTDEGTAVTNLTAAVDAWIAAHPGVDLTAEDTAVQSAAAAVATQSQALATELANVTPPPAP